MEETSNTSLWNKNVDDLTVGDAVKLNAAVLGGTIALAAVVAGAAVVADKVSTWRRNRREARLANVIDVG